MKAPAMPQVSVAAWPGASTSLLILKPHIMLTVWLVDGTTPTSRRKVAGTPTRSVRHLDVSCPADT